MAMKWDWSYDDFVDSVKLRCDLARERITLQYREPKRGRAASIALESASDYAYLLQAVKSNPKAAFVVVAQVWAGTCVLAARAQCS